MDSMTFNGPSEYEKRLEQRTLYPMPFRHPSDSTSPSSSRRGSMSEGGLHRLLSIQSPPSSPRTTPALWRRESLPSISFITHPIKNYGHLFEDNNPRRHSIAFGASQEQQQEDLVKKRRDSSPYSRSPELRISHKLAERKRRKEMKDLFEDLRELLPLDKGLKTSKWEILSKTLEYIRLLQDRESIMEREKAELLNELNAYKR